MWWWLIILPISVILFCACYLFLHLFWHKNKTKGDRYFSLPLEQRIKIEKSLKKHTYILIPFISILSIGKLIKKLPYFKYKGIASPSAISNINIFKKAEEYTVSQSDIFIVTQMKCGTTWMQQIVFEILHHGEGDLSDEGYRHLYALSPWIEASPLASVSIERAPLVSSYKKRIIKTHLPVDLCPFSAAVKYICYAKSY